MVWNTRFSGILTVKGGGEETTADSAIFNENHCFPSKKHDFERVSGLGELCIGSGRFVWLRDVAGSIPGLAGLPEHRQRDSRTIFHVFSLRFQRNLGQRQVGERVIGVRTITNFH